MSLTRKNPSVLWCVRVPTAFKFADITCKYQRDGNERSSPLSTEPPLRVYSLIENPVRYCLNLLGWLTILCNTVYTSRVAYTTIGAWTHVRWRVHAPTHKEVKLDIRIHLNRPMSTRRWFIRCSNHNNTFLHVDCSYGDNSQTLAFLPTICERHAIPPGIVRCSFRRLNFMQRCNRTFFDTQTVLSYINVSRDLPR